MIKGIHSCSCSGSLLPYRFELVPALHVDMRLHIFVAFHLFQFKNMEMQEMAVVSHCRNCPVKLNMIASLHIKELFLINLVHLI